jgi:glyoxylase-like metal-dependent hydrolase (beta-lactamase superfamily II)
MLEPVGAEQLGPGLWRWTAFHTEWKQEVGSLAYEQGDELVLIDPLKPETTAGTRRFWKALDEVVRQREQPVAVVLTLHYHVRHAPEVVGRYRSAPGAALWAPVGSVPKLSHDPDRAFSPGDALPADIRALPTSRDDEVVLWLPAARTIVAGDALLGGKRRPLRVCPQSWLPRSITRAALAASLAPLLELPVDLVVPLHGDPVTTDAHDVLADALAEAA